MFRNFAISYARKNIRMRAVRKLSFQRQSVAYLLSISARAIPHAAGNVEFDVTPLYDYGRRFVENMKAQGDKHTAEELTRMAVHKNFSAFYLKMIAHVLHHVPVMNTMMEWTPLRNGGSLYECDDIFPSFTVHTKQGVMTPIIRNPHQKTLVDVANEMRVLTRKARRTDMNELYRKCAWKYLSYAVRELDISSLTVGWLWLRSCLWPEPMADDVKNVPENEKLQAEHMVGSTCTIANIGMSVDGWQTVTVIPPPSTFMWGIGLTRELPRVVDGQIVPRQIVTVAVTFDHRAMDGGDIFEFVDVMNGYIQKPERIFEWKPGDPV